MPRGRAAALLLLVTISSAAHTGQPAPLETLYGAHDWTGLARAQEAKEIRGVGNAETFESIAVPELRFEIGGFLTALRPAHVILKSIGAKHSLGNLGLDLLKQARALQIDFGAMTLELEPKR